MDKELFASLKSLVDARQSLQKSRIQYSNRVQAIESGRDTASRTTLDLLDRTYERFAIAEKEHDDLIEEFASQIAIINHAVNVKGIGLISIAKVVSMIDIEIADTVSSLWRYAGYAVTDEGKAQRRVKGVKLDYNSMLRTACYNIGTGLLKSNSPYRAIYDEAKEIYIGKGWTKMHAHLASIRKMMKIFLQHLWLVWRHLESLPVTDPYIVTVGGHSKEHILKPEDYGWPVFR